MSVSHFSANGHTNSTAKKPNGKRTRPDFLNYRAKDNHYGDDGDDEDFYQRFHDDGDPYIPMSATEEAAAMAECDAVALPEKTEAETIKEEAAARRAARPGRPTFSKLPGRNLRTREWVRFIVTDRLKWSGLKPQQKKSPVTLYVLLGQLAYWHETDPKTGKPRSRQKMHYQKMCWVRLNVSALAKTMYIDRKTIRGALAKLEALGLLRAIKVTTNGIVEPYHFEGGPGRLKQEAEVYCGIPADDLMDEIVDWADHAPKRSKRIRPKQVG